MSIWSSVKKAEGAKKQDPSVCYQVVTASELLEPRLFLSSVSVGLGTISRLDTRNYHNEPTTFFEIDKVISYNYLTFFRNLGPKST